ncbi:MAG: antitoxin VapB family protein [Halobacteriaceae archaeon]
MTKRTISLDEEAYERLAARKCASESFSDVVKRLAGERSWTEVTGVLSDAEAAELEDALAEGRGRSRGRTDRSG